MSKKIEKASDELVELFEKVKEDKTSIPDWIVFQLHCCVTQKELYKVIKSNEVNIATYEEKLKESIDFTVVINEDIFDQLPDNMKELVLIECLNGISVSDKDVLSHKKPDFNTYYEILAKYGNDEVIKLHESIKSLFDVKKQKEDEEKVTKKKIKKQ